MLPLQDRVDLGVMAMKGYFTFSKAPTLLKLYHQIVSCHIQDICWNQEWGVLPLCWDAVSVFYIPSLLDIFLLGAWGLTFLERCSQCILQPPPPFPQLTRPTICKEFLIFRFQPWCKVIFSSVRCACECIGNNTTIDIPNTKKNKQTWTPL